MATSQYQAVLARVRQNREKSAAQAGAKQGDPVSDVTDPTKAGNPSTPVDPKADPKLQQTPKSEENGAAKPGLETPTDAKGTLQGDPATSTVDGNAKDRAVTSPTSKIASATARLTSAVTLLRTGAAAPVKSASDAATKPTGDGKAADPTAAKAPAPDASKTKADEKGLDTPAAGKPGGEKAAGDRTANDMTLSREAHVKLAAAIFETEGGLEFAHRLIKQAKGAEIADRLIADAAAFQEQQNIAAQAAHDGQASIDAMFKGASAQEQETIIKVAQTHDFALSRFEKLASLAAERKDAKTVAHVELLKAAYVGGAADAAAMEDAGGELPGAGEDISDEEILAVLQQMADAGEIPPEVFEQLAMLLSGGAAGGAPAEDPMLAGAEAAAPEGGEEGAAAAGGEPTPDDAAKSASAKDPVGYFTGAGRKDAPESIKLAAAILSEAQA